MSQNLKLFSLIRTLSVEEQIAFQKHLKRVHREDTVALSVFAYYKHFFLKGGREEKMDPSYAYQKVFGAEVSDTEHARKKILNTLSDLYLCLKDFLLAHKMRSDTLEAQLLWLDVLQERGLNNESHKLATRIYENTCKKVLLDSTACHQQISAGHSYKSLVINGKSTPDFQALAECTHRIKQSTDILSLKMACEILTYQKTHPHEVESAQGPVQPLFILYQRIFALLSTNQEKEFHQAVSLLKEYANYISLDETLNILRFLHNYVAQKIRSGQDREWVKELHELNKISLQKDMITPKSNMSLTYFCNIVNTACAAQEIEWAHTFIADYKHFLPESERAESILLAQAIIEFEQKNFKKALQITENLQFKHFQHVARSKAIKLKSLYELDPSDDKIWDHCLSFEVYLLRHRTPKTEFIEATLSFIRLFKLFMSKKLSKDQLLNKIETTPTLYFKSWLLEKARHYKARHTKQKQQGK